MAVANWIKITEFAIEKRLFNFVLPVQLKHWKYTNVEKTVIIVTVLYETQPAC